MSKKKLFIIGSGGHASACIDLIESINSFKIVGIFSDDKKIKKNFHIQLLELLKISLSIRKLQIT